jgi:hypothetical protein
VKTHRIKIGEEIKPILQYESAATTDEQERLLRIFEFLFYDLILEEKP